MCLIARIIKFTICYNTLPDNFGSSQVLPIRRIYYSLKNRNNLVYGITEENFMLEYYRRIRSAPDF